MITLFKDVFVYFGEREGTEGERESPAGSLLSAEPNMEVISLHPKIMTWAEINQLRQQSTN